MQRFPTICSIFYMWQRQKTFSVQWAYLVHSVLNFGLGGFLIHYSVDYITTLNVGFVFISML